MSQRVSGSADLVLLRKGGYFYRPNAQGYTSHFNEAGLFTRDAALNHASLADGVTVHEIAEFSAAADCPKGNTVLSRDTRPIIGIALSADLEIIVGESNVASINAYDESDGIGGYEPWLAVIDNDARLVARVPARNTLMISYHENDKADGD